jgi:hypothetical protein
VPSPSPRVPTPSPKPVKPSPSPQRELLAPDFGLVLQPGLPITFPSTLPKLPRLGGVERPAICDTCRWCTLICG